MQLVPKKTHKAYPKKTCSRKNHVLQLGISGLKILTSTRLTESQIKSFEWVLKKLLKSRKNHVKLWPKFNLNLNLTKLSAESRMGKGKGSIYTKAQFLKAGSIFFEFSETNKQTNKQIITYLSKIFPKKFKLIELTQFKGRETQR